MATNVPTRTDPYTGPERRERIVDRRAAARPAPRSLDSRTIAVSTSDIGAVFLSVFAGLGVTLLLVIVGMAIGAVTFDSFDGGIASFVGWWVIGSGLVGAFVGGLLGGRAAGLLGRAAPIAHGTASWGLTFLAVVLMSGALSLSLFNTATDATASLGTDLEVIADEVAADTGTDADEILASLEGGAVIDVEEVTDGAGEGAWWLTGWLVLSLIGAVGGWLLGAASSPFGRARTDDAVVRD